MLHLAQVKKNPTSGKMELQLLAQQQAENTWTVGNSEVLSCNTDYSVTEGMLVLLELDNNQQIVNLKEAKDWVINLVQQYLTQDAITTEFVQEEKARVEQWRQEITAQSLDLTRRHLEIEARRDQLQDLEATLKQEKETLDIRWQKLKEIEVSLEQEKEKL